MKKISISRGKFALVDDSDFDRLSQFAWVYTVSPSGNEYAHTTVKTDSGRKTVKMHTMILGVKKGLEIDHINSNGLDNRKSNLRHATRAQNQANSRVKSNSKTQLKGIHQRADNGRWRVHIHRDGKRVWLGHFGTKDEAIKVRNQYVLANDGKFARAI